jgi:hypothetical protein
MTAFTSRKGPFSGTPFRGRRIKPHAWKRSLFSHTRHLNHWRSNSAQAFTTSTGGTVGVGNIVVHTPLVPIAGMPFWTIGGGAVSTDTGVAVPLFDGDIILRGGKIGITLVKDVTSTDVIQVQVWVFRLIPNPELGLIPSNSPLGWDPSLTADISRAFGKVIGYKTTTMTVTGEDFTMEYRLGVQKMDQHIVATDTGSQPLFFIKCTNLTSNTDVNVHGLIYHNVSFTGDAIGST